MWNVRTVRCHRTPETFHWRCFQFCVYSDKTTWLPQWKISLGNPGNSISETLNFKMSLDASALKNVCLWCKFQSCLLFIISLLLKTFLTALETLYLSKGRKWFEPFNIRIILLHVFPHPGFWKGNKQNNRWAVQIIFPCSIPCANSWSQCLLWGAVYNDSLCRGRLEL